MTAPALAATAAATPIRVLFVDDEANVLQGLQRSLRSLRHAWEMTFVVGGAAAIAELERRPFDVVVTDMRMPGSDGAEVLGAASRLHPEALRIVLSGQAPREVLTRASIHAHQFLWKPCATEVLSATVHDALALRRDLSAPGLGRLVAEVGGLPTLEPRLRALMTELARAEVDLAAVSNVVGQDLGLSTRVLRIANSALYSLGSPPASVRHAVELLGTQSLAAMLASLGVIERFPVELADDAAAMQLHATRSSSFAHNAVTALGLPMRPDVAFTAGLLHDIGAWHLLSRRPELRRCPGAHRRGRSGRGGRDRGLRRDACPARGADARRLGLPPRGGARRGEPPPPPDRAAIGGARRRSRAAGRPLRAARQPPATHRP